MTGAGDAAVAVKEMGSVLISSNNVRFTCCASCVVCSILVVDVMLARRDCNNGDSLVYFNGERCNNGSAVMEPRCCMDVVVVVVVVGSDKRLDVDVPMIAFNMG